MTRRASRWHLDSHKYSHNLFLYIRTHLCTSKYAPWAKMSDLSMWNNELPKVPGYEGSLSQVKWATISFVYCIPCSMWSQCSWNKAGVMSLLSQYILDRFIRTQTLFSKPVKVIGFFFYYRGRCTSNWDAARNEKRGQKCRRKCRQCKETW